MDVSIIIVNWHSKDYLKRCLERIYENTSNIDYEVIVIDSASYDGSEQMVSNEYPQVSFIQSRENLGFAKANNAAFKASRGKVVLFLNPDTEIIDNAIEKLFSVMNGSDRIGAVGGRILNSDGTVQNTAIRAFPTLLNQMFDSDLLKRILPNSRLWGMAPLFGSGDATAEVDAISGACIMVRRDAFEEVKMFSEDYFMYSEDIDLCRKIWDHGWKIKYIPDALITHHGGGSSSQSGQSNFSNVMMLESRYTFFCKFHSAAYGRIFKAAVFMTSLLRLSILLSLLPLTKLAGQRTALRNATSKWLARLSWTMGMDRSLRRFKSPAKSGAN